MTVNSEAAILSRILRPDEAGLSLDAARSILKLEFDASDKQRMHELAERSQDGLLTPADQTELENYRQVGFLLDLMKSKARSSLKRLDQPR